jgi:hypothetical protein
MCGIVAAIALTNQGFPQYISGTFSSMLTADVLRGPDSTGYFLVDNTGKIRFGKVASHPFRLMASKAYEDSMHQLYSRGQVIVGHNRKATSGDITNENAHPFHHEHIIMVHNGMLSNYRSFGDFEVDSMAIPKVLAEHEDPKKALRLLDGHFAIMWYNAKTDTLHWVRNEHRPLSMARAGNVLYIASEAKMLDWILTRFPGPAVKHEPVEQDVLYTFDLGSLKVTTERATFKQWGISKVVSAMFGEDEPEGEPAAARKGKPNLKMLVAANEKPPADENDSSMTTGRVEFQSTSIDLSLPTVPILLGVTNGATKHTVKYRIKNEAELASLRTRIGGFYSGILSHHCYRGTVNMYTWVKSAVAHPVYKTWNGEHLSLAEWKSIAKSSSCSGCGLPIGLRWVKYTSVNFKGTDKPKVVCPECVAKKLSAVPEVQRKNAEAGAGYPIADYFKERQEWLKEQSSPAEPAAVLRPL